MKNYATRFHGIIKLPGTNSNPLGSGRAKNKRYLCTPPVDEPIQTSNLREAIALEEKGYTISPPLPKKEENRKKITTPYTNTYNCTRNRQCMWVTKKQAQRLKKEGWTVTPALDGYSLKKSKKTVGISGRFFY